MKQTDLDILLREGEGSMLEYKESFSPSLARDLAAFANSSGGKILLGVRDDGRVIGVRDNNQLRAQIQDIARNCDPPVKVLIEVVGKIMVITVREGENKPVQCREGFFWRQGASTQKLSRDEIRDFFRSEGAIRFDLTVCPKFRYPEDFDREKFDAWISQSRITPRRGIDDVLVNIEVAERAGKRLIFRNAGVLFFAKDVRHFFPQAYITCLLAKGIDKVNILDRKDFAEGLVSDIEESLRFIERNTRTGYRIEKLRREDVPEYPMRALREAITNAIMHRDYFQAGANVFVEIYDDRIEISNPGGLPRGLSREELGTRSVRRNPLIADLLHRIALIEKAGTGIRRMMEDARQHKCPEPKFTVNGFFTATFWPNVGLSRKIVPQVGEEVTGEVAGEVGTKLALSRHQVEILHDCVQEKSLLGIMSQVGRKDRTKFRTKFIKPLVESGLLEMTTPDKPRSSRQRYRTTDLGRKVLNQRRGG
ncbi:MAG: transcriptional regulator [Deltaproteobacteria bacterium]|nr:transcriptional regulator [Deltaproteobacteria bacterium]